MYGYIYKTTNLCNQRFYIGKRVKSKFDKSYHGSGKILKNALKKYGIENFKTEVLIEVDCKNTLELLERYFIAQYRNLGFNIYNIAKGGEGGDTLSDHPRKLEIYKFRAKKIAEAFKKNPRVGRKGKNHHFWGKKRSLEDLKKMSLARKGKSLSKEHKKKISLGLLNTKHNYNWSQEAKQRIRTPLDENLLIKLYFEYKTGEEIAKELETTASIIKTRISLLVKEGRLTHRPRKFSHSSRAKMSKAAKLRKRTKKKIIISFDKEKLIELYSNPDYINLYIIAESLNLTHSRVKGIVNDMIKNGELIKRDKNKRKICLP
jgi:group I intron endonuclease